MGLCVNDVSDHNSIVAKNVSCSVTRVPVCAAVRHRVVLFYVCGRYGSIGICWVCRSSSHLRCMTMVGREGSTPECSVSGDYGSSCWALFPRVSILRDVAVCG